MGSEFVITHMPPHLPSDVSFFRRGLKKILIALGCLVAIPLVLLFIATGLGWAKIYQIPTDSMSPTLVKGDFITAYRFKSDAPRSVCGTLVVVNVDGIQSFGGSLKGQYVMRIVAIPGDKVSIRNGSIYVNDEQIARGGVVSEAPKGVPGGLAVNFPLVVPPNHAFMMGDNYSNSLDSRYFGPIEAKRISHRPFRLVFPLNRAGEIK